MKASTRVRGWLLAACAVMLADGAMAQAPRSEPLRFDDGGTVAVASGRVTGSDRIDLVLEARGGERVVAMLEAGANGYFNVLPPGSTGEAIFIGSTSGERFEGTLEQAGEYRFRIYQMRASGRRGESFDYTLRVERAPPVAAAEGAAAFRQSLSLHGITYEVSSDNLARGNVLRIVPRGLADNSEIVQPIDGIVTGAEIGDLDVDQAPEVYVYVRLPGDDARMALVAYSSNRNRSLSAIHLPPLEDVPGAAAGYAGRDGMAVVESAFARRFPLDGGRWRQLQYRLAKGEASWVLKFDRMDEF
ncbi:MAG: hypothetical protein LW860_09070 [Xanthomonadaceae bacterium]|jgi:hypothetical protein|nr:hypothetical protein [Xanthomonadaceae bacterium]